MAESAGAKDIFELQIDNWPRNRGTDLKIQDLKKIRDQLKENEVLKQVGMDLLDEMPNGIPFFKGSLNGSGTRQYGSQPRAQETFLWAFEWKEGNRGDTILPINEWPMKRKGQPMAAGPIFKLLNTFRGLPAVREINLNVLDDYWLGKFNLADSANARVLIVATEYATPEHLAKEEATGKALKAQAVKGMESTVADILTRPANEGGLMMSYIDAHHKKIKALEDEIRKLKKKH